MSIRTFVFQHNKSNGPVTCQDLYEEVTTMLKNDYGIKEFRCRVRLKNSVFLNIYYDTYSIPLFSRARNYLRWVILRCLQKQKCWKFVITKSVVDFCLLLFFMTKQLFYRANDCHRIWQATRSAMCSTLQPHHWNCCFCNDASKDLVGSKLKNHVSHTYSRLLNIYISSFHYNALSEVSSFLSWWHRWEGWRKLVEHWLDLLLDQWRTMHKMQYTFVFSLVVQYSFTKTLYVD